MRDQDLQGQRGQLDRNEADVARAPGRSTNVDPARRPGAAVPGKQTLVDSGGGHMLESAIADAQKYVG